MFEGSQNQAFFSLFDGGANGKTDSIAIIRGRRRGSNVGNVTL